MPVVPLPYGTYRPGLCRLQVWCLPRVRARARVMRARGARFYASVAPFRFLKLLAGCGNKSRKRGLRSPVVCERFVAAPRFWDSFFPSTPSVAPSVTSEAPLSGRAPQDWGALQRGLNSTGLAYKGMLCDFAARFSFCARAFTMFAQCAL